AFDGTDVNVRESVSMIAPFSQATFPAKGMVRQAQWSVINDYGGSSKLYQSAVQGGGK
ncbi:TPA: molecular chaperone, partial [Klebsiella pneumoniae]|nr:molecular chaperone [Klebsiella pneumoniae]